MLYKSSACFINIDRNRTGQFVWESTFGSVHNNNNNKNKKRMRKQALKYVLLLKSKQQECILDIFFPQV